MRAFTNKILSFSKKVREEIDSMIEKNASPGVIRRNLMNNFKDEVDTLDIKTIRSYINYVKNGHVNVNVKNTSIVPFEKQTEKLEQELAEIQNEQSQLESSYITDKNAYIDILVFKVNKKLGMLENLDKIWGNIDLRKESLYHKYISLAKDLVETKAKLSGEISSDSNIVVNIMNSKLSEFNRIVYEAVKEVCPEKLIQFQEVYKRKYMEMKSNEVEDNTSKKVN